MSAEPEIDGVVSVVEPHSPITPLAKSNRVAVRDCDERVSPMKTLKQCPARPVLVRFSPPSKNCAVGRLWPTPVVLAAVSHGVVTVAVLAVAQAESLVPVCGSRQSTPCAEGVGFRNPGNGCAASMVQRYTSIVLTTPPFVNAETISRSPSR